MATQTGSTGRSVVGATGAWSKSVVVVGLEALSRVPRDTTATTLKEG